jgi:hypothetical protein
LRCSSLNTPPRVGLLSTTSPSPRVRVPRDVARLVMRHVAPLVVDYSASRGSSSTTPPRTGSKPKTPPRAGSSSTTSPPSCVQVPQHVARLVMRHVAPLVVDYTASRRLFVDYSASRRLVVDNSATRRLVVDYFASVVRPGASAHRAAHHAARHAARRRLLRLAQARRRLLCLVQARRRLLPLP